jgi:protein-S-isoprenylcysteine O-methyltransferase Ste14
MITETIAAGFLLICLGLFFSINLYNFLAVHRSSRGVRSYAEVDRSSSAASGLAVLGTTAYFAEASFYPLLVSTNSISTLSIFNVNFPNTDTTCLLTSGLLLTAGGYSPLLWSITARCKYAPFLEMQENRKRVTCGPYRHVCHLSYLAHLMIFIGLFATWPGWLTLIPLSSIPGHFSVNIKEDKLIERRFGQQYLEYRTKTRRFFPKPQDLL